MQVSAASSAGHELLISNAKSEGRSQRLVSKESFGVTRQADSFERTLAGQTQPSIAQPSYTAEVLKKDESAKISSATQTQNTTAPGEPQTAETVQFTQADIDNLMKLFGSTAGDGNFMSQYDLDGSGTIDLQDLNAMLSQINTAEASGGEDAQAFTQEDLDLLLDSFGAQVGDDSYSEALDLDGDGIIGLPDLNLMLANFSQPETPQTFTQSHLDQLTEAFGSVSGDENFVAELDLNGDGTLDLSDLNQMLAAMSNA